MTGCFPQKERAKQSFQKRKLLFGEKGIKKGVGWGGGGGPVDDSLLRLAPIKAPQDAKKRGRIWKNPSFWFGDGAGSGNKK